MTLNLKNGTERVISWEPGTALAYKGMEIPHARGDLPKGHTSFNLFLHYTNAEEGIHNY